MKYIYAILGAITFSIGTVAIWIPGIPTTGFYVATAFFWSRASDRLNNWLINQPAYQKYVTEAIYERKLSQKGRIGIYIVTAAMMAIPFFTSDLVWLKPVLILASLSQIISMEGYYRGFLFKSWFRNHHDSTK